MTLLVNIIIVAAYTQSFTEFFIVFYKDTHLKKANNCSWAKPKGEHTTTDGLVCLSHIKAKFV